MSSRHFSVPTTFSINRRGERVSAFVSSSVHFTFLRHFHPPSPSSTAGSADAACDTPAILTLATPTCMNTSRTSLFDFQFNMQGRSKSSDFVAAWGRNRPLMGQRQHKPSMNDSFFCFDWLRLSQVVWFLKKKKRQWLYNPEKYSF